MKIDPYTKEDFEPNRTNQRFACSTNRINYHNEIARKKRMITRDTDYTITNNWNILLKQLGGSEKIFRSKEFMLGTGFDFKYYQRAYKTEAGVMQVIYNCGYIVNNAKDKVILFKLK